MTTEQLTRANELVKKISQSKSYLDKINDSFTSTAQCLPNYFKIQFDGSTVHFEFTPSWIQQDDIKKDVIKILNNTSIQLRQAFEADLAAMELELSNL